MSDSMQSYQAKFRELSTQGIDQGGSLLHHQIAGSMQDQDRLLFSTLHRNKPHGWPADCLADRLRVDFVILAAFHIWLHVTRQHQASVMTERR